MERDRRTGEALATSQLRDMEHIHLSFPFGIDISERILARCRSLVSLATGENQGFSGRPANKDIHSAVADVSAAYTELHRMDTISWIENHELVRKRFAQLLSSSSRKTVYKMSETEMRRWRQNVVVFTRGFATKLKRRRKFPGDFERKAQICIDVIHTLITSLRDNSEDALYCDDYAFLVSLCQRATLLPRSFSCPDILQVGEDEPVDAGASANIYRGSLGCAEVAVKSFRLYYRTMKQVKKRFIREALILHVVRHPNILRFTSIVDEELKICIITPWYGYGHIMKYIARVQDADLKELMEQVADGLHFLCQYRIVHGDLKGTNVLIDNDGKAVIADLGLSFIQDSTSSVTEQSHTAQDPFALAILRAQCAEAIRSGRLSLSPRSISTLAATVLSAASAASSTGGGTFWWIAPERLVPSAYDLPTAKATMKSDVFSFGMLMLENPPGETFRVECSIALSVVTNIRPARPSSIPDNLWEIVCDCWSHFPDRRPSIQEVYNRLACIP
ncbi:kinase-like domain-containing protein [Mycena alexandri]|uniref:Kinase-like domain-containing protein n=1 Tax=Mycena alexandri TaxID=1745969 RepID=A0AAD6SMK2_9AGAR|nr:kinase-like domain-containing protein [Mycena alexandri]